MEHVITLKDVLVVGAGVAAIVIVLALLLRPADSMNSDI